MDCEQYQEALSAAALGVETGGDVQAFLLHLEVCEGCRGELARRREFLASVDHRLLTQLEAAPSADFSARLRRRISDEAPRALRPGLQWLPVFAGAVALALLLALFHFHRDRALQPRDPNPVRDVSSAERPAPQVPSLGNSQAPPQESAVSGVSPPERLLLHPVAATLPSPALKVRIDHRELYAVVRLTQAVADGRVGAAALLDSQLQPDESVAAKPLEIPPLELKPIEDSALESEAAGR
jgi:putative zinc finger protein